MVSLYCVCHFPGTDWDRRSLLVFSVSDEYEPLVDFVCERARNHYDIIHRTKEDPRALGIDFPRVREFFGADALEEIATMCAYVIVRAAFGSEIAETEGIASLLVRGMDPRYVERSVIDLAPQLSEICRLFCSEAIMAPELFGHVLDERGKGDDMRLLMRNRDFITMLAALDVDIEKVFEYLEYLEPMAHRWRAGEVSLLELRTSFRHGWGLVKESPVPF